MNWQRGFKRVWYFLLGCIWAVFAIFAIIEGAAPAQLGSLAAALTMFSLAWIIVGGILVWVAKGFTRDQKPGPPR